VIGLKHSASFNVLLCHNAFGEHDAERLKITRKAILVNRLLHTLNKSDAIHELEQFFNSDRSGDIRPKHPTAECYMHFDNRSP
jgi:hypothetical protein